MAIRLGSFEEETAWAFLLANGFLANGFISFFMVSMVSIRFATQPGAATLLNPTPLASNPLANVLRTGM